MLASGGRSVAFAAQRQHLPNASCASCAAAVPPRAASASGRRAAARGRASALRVSASQCSSVPASDFPSLDVFELDALHARLRCALTCLLTLRPQLVQTLSSRLAMTTLHVSTRRERHGRRGRVLSGRRHFPYSGLPIEKAKR